MIFLHSLFEATWYTEEHSAAIWNPQCIIWACNGFQIAALYISWYFAGSISAVAAYYCQFHWAYDNCEFVWSAKHWITLISTTLLHIIESECLPVCVSACLPSLKLCPPEIMNINSPSCWQHVFQISLESRELSARKVKFVIFALCPSRLKSG